MITYIIGMIVIYAAGILGVAYVLAVVLVTAMQRRLIFVPDTSHPGPPPAELQRAEYANATTRDGLTLYCWFVMPATPAQPVILYLHGNGGHLGYRTARLQQCARLGWGALMVGYRGYGGNPGTPSERGLLTDAQAGYALLIDKGISPNRIVVWGESLGSGLAVQLAADTAIGALVLEAPYTSLTELARLRFPWVPVTLLLRHKFDSLARITRGHCPLFVLAGERDEVVPLAMSRRLFAAANQPKVLRVQPHASHNDIGTTDAFDAVAAFLSAHLVDAPTTDTSAARSSP